MLDLLRWIIGALFLCIFAVLAGANVLIVIRFFLRHQRTSLIPIIGGLFGAGGLLIIPLDSVRMWWWVPLLLDVGCAPMMLASATEAALLLRRSRASRRGKSSDEGG